MEKRIVERPLPETGVKLAGLHPVLQRVYAARGVRSHDELELKLARLAQPRMGGLARAAGLLADAIESGASILVVGDYDCDGATATALCLLALRAMGAGRVDYLVPSRFDFGYGLTPGLVEVAARRQPDLILTVDNGISSVAGVARARELGIQVVVTDHHLPGDQLPEADAIVDPNLPGDPFPAKGTAGVGVAFYLLTAVRAELRRRGWFAGRAAPTLAEWLDLVALGTVADVVPLEYNNRILVEQGLRRIRAGRCRPGLLALLAAAGRDHRTLRASDLGFVLGPRINAAGRLDDISVGIECLLAETLEAARPLAEALDAHNRERRQIEAGMKEQALVSVARLFDGDDPPWGLCLKHDDWHQGVVGLVASRIKERYQRPVIAFAPGDEGELKGSARSIPGLHIRDALAEVVVRHPGLVTKFGGHAMAAGLSLYAEGFETFARAFDAVVRSHLRPEDLEPVIVTDGAIDPGELGLELALALEQAGPWGQGFPEPLFHGGFEVVHQRLLKDRHWKLVVRAQGGGDPLDAIAFNLAEQYPDAVPERVRLVYQLECNRFRGTIAPQLQVLYMERA